jgi:hypothetical protein
LIVQRRSQATVVILVGVLAITAFAVMPGGAQGVDGSKVVTRIPCKPILADSTRCRLGRLQICQHFAELRTQPYLVRCHRWQECRPAGKPC